LSNAYSQAYLSPMTQFLRKLSNSKMLLDRNCYLEIIKKLYTQTSEGHVH